MAKFDNSRASLELLYNISRELTTSLDLHTVLTRVLFLSISNVGAERGTLIVVDQAGHPVDAAIVIGNQLHSHTLEKLQETLDQGLAGWVVRNRQSALVSDTSEDVRWVRRPDDDSENSGPKSAIVVPVLAREQLVGVMTIVHLVPGFFTPDHLALAEAIASQAGTAISNAQLYDSLQSVNRRYRELFEDNIDPILISNWDGKILEANRQAANATGYGLVELIGQTVFDLHEVSQESLGEKFNQLEDGLTINYESRMKTAKRGTIPVAVYVRKVNLSSENAIQWILRNISERKALDVMREDLTAMIYHDLRSPLANIVSSLDMLEAIIPPGTAPSVETLFNISSRSIDRMQRLINSLLDINRLETGKPITNQKAIDLHVLVKDAVDAVMPIVESKHQVVQISLPADLPELWVDTDMIRRVIINLVENATKFTPMNESMTIGGQSEGDWVRMWIIDRGQGISPEFHEQIFEKFTRLQSDHYPKGMGLGLAFCRLAVQAHGGKIWVESEANKGSTFIFTLPVVKSPT